MPRKKGVPSLRRHKPSKQGVVRLNGTDFYLGVWPDGQEDPPAEVQVAYARTIAEWDARGRQPIPPPPPESAAVPSQPPDGEPVAYAPSAGLTVADLAVRFMGWAELHYRHNDGTPTSEMVGLRYALRPLVYLYGAQPAADFGPLKLKAVRELMIKGYDHPRHGPQGRLCRKLVNARVNRIVRLFSWGVSEELVPETVHRALATVKALEKGRTAAHDYEDVEPVPITDVEVTLPFLTAHVRTAVVVQMRTGARAGEVLSLRGRDLDTREAVWLYRVPQHKGTWRDDDLVIPLGPRAREALAPLLKVRCPLCQSVDRAGRLGWCPTAPLCGPCRDRADEQGVCGPWPEGWLTAEEEAYYVFSPREAMADRDRERRGRRKTKVQPSQACRKKKGARQYAERYTVRCYNQMIERGAKRAGVPHWSSHQLRHLAGTEARRRYGLEAAQHLLGHKQLKTTELYAEKNLELTRRLAEEMG